MPSVGGWCQQTGYEDSGLEQNGHEAVMRQRSHSMVVVRRRYPLAHSCLPLAP